MLMRSALWFPASWLEDRNIAGLGICTHPWSSTSAAALGQAVCRRRSITICSNSSYACPLGPSPQQCLWPRLSTLGWWLQSPLWKVSPQSCELSLRLGQKLCAEYPLLCPELSQELWEVAPGTLPLVSSPCHLAVSTMWPSSICTNHKPTGNRGCIGWDTGQNRRKEFCIR